MIEAAPQRSMWWIRALGSLPWSLLYGLTGSIAWCSRYVVRFRVAEARANLQRCFPHKSTVEIEQILNAFYRQLGEVSAEFFKLSTLSLDQMRRHVVLVGCEEVIDELNAGRSAMLLSAHHCNWEWALQGVTTHLPRELVAAYKPLHSERADREMRLLRERFGAQMVAGKRLFREVVRNRKIPRSIAIIADQVPASSGGRQWLSFLGRDTAFFPGPGEMAKATGFAAWFFPMRRLRRGYYEMGAQRICSADEHLPAEEFTRRYAALLEAMVSEQPADWMWLHRRWKLARPSSARSTVTE